MNNENMSRSWQRGFEAARAASVHSSGPNVGQKLGAALYAGSILLSVGFNDWTKTHPNEVHDTHVGNTHAEVMAVVKRWHYEKSKNLTLYVSRTITNPEQTVVQWGCSRPCAKCMKLIKEYGVRRVRFFDEFGLPCEMKL